MPRPRRKSKQLQPWWLKVRLGRLLLVSASAFYLVYLIALHKRLPKGQTPKKYLLQSSRIESAHVQRSAFMDAMGNSPARVTAEDVWAEEYRMALADARSKRNGTAGYTTPEELEGRPFRFPTAEERVKIYMGNWYAPPCEGNTKAEIHYKMRENPMTNQSEALLRELAGPGISEEDRRVFLLHGDIDMATLFFMQRGVIEGCDNDFCMDTMKYLFPAYDRVVDHSAAFVPTVLQFGDSDTVKSFIPAYNSFGFSPNVPIIKKFRRSFTREAISAMSATKCIAGHREVHSADVDDLQPAIWKLTARRHFGMLEEISVYDIPWSQKLNVAIFRGGMTGRHKAGLTNQELEQLSAGEKCEIMERCKLVVNTDSSPLVNASLVGPQKGLPHVVNGVQIFGEKLDYSEMLRYKAIIMLEGNDISSGLKWALYSRSVVMTRKPTLTSWAMEELLMPWVHYVPLNDDLTDVEEKMQWIVDNDEEAQKIAHRGALWIKDLIFHPEASIDDRLIFEEMLRRYRAHFISDPGLFFFG